MESVGGLIGRNEGTVEQSWADCSVVSLAGGSVVGGLVGYGYGRAVISRMLRPGSCEGLGHFVGGLVGAISSAKIRSSYARGSVTGVDSVGGLIG